MVVQLLTVAVLSQAKTLLRLTAQQLMQVVMWQKISLLLDWLALHRDTMHAVLTIWVSYCDNGLVKKEKHPHQVSVIAH